MSIPAGQKIEFILMKIYNIDFIIIERKDDIRRIFLNQRYKEDISPHDSINIQNFRHWYLKNENT